MANTLTITVTDGRLSVEGPIHDRVLCYGLLEGAKDVVRDHLATRPGVVEAADAQALHILGGGGVAPKASPRGRA